MTFLSSDVAGVSYVSFFFIIMWYMYSSEPEALCATLDQEVG